MSAEFEPSKLEEIIVSELVKSKSIDKEKVKSFSIEALTSDKGSYKLVKKMKINIDIEQ